MKRYDYISNFPTQGEVKMLVEEDGDYVLFSDHEKEIAERDKKIDELHDSRFAEARRVDTLNSILAENKKVIDAQREEIEEDNQMLMRQGKKIDLLESRIKTLTEALEKISNTAYSSYDIKIAKEALSEKGEKV